MANNEINVKTTFNRQQIISDATLENARGGIEVISQRVISLQDEGVKAALLALGWTPPHETDPQKQEFEHFYGRKVFENQGYVVRIRERGPQDSARNPALDIKVHRKDRDGKEQLPSGYMLGSNTLLVEDR
jgi:hypothetical protein